MHYKTKEKQVREEQFQFLGSLFYNASPAATSRIHTWASYETFNKYCKNKDLENLINWLEPKMFATLGKM